MKLLDLAKIILLRRPFRDGEGFAAALLVGHAYPEAVYRPMALPVGSMQYASDKVITPAKR